jgi:hypothetical protein
MTAMMTSDENDDNDNDNDEVGIIVDVESI